MLLEFSFFIQDNSQKLKGKDFRGRFAWRLVLLLFIACINSALFPGEILVLYALLGYVLIAVCRLSTRTVTIIAVILLLQPIELGQIIYALIRKLQVSSGKLLRLNRSIKWISVIPITANPRSTSAISIRLS